MPRNILPVALGLFSILAPAPASAFGPDPLVLVDASPAAAVPAPTFAPRFVRPPSPNPSLGEVSFVISNPRAQDLEISIFDLRGRRLANLWNGRLAPGESTFRWNGNARAGRRAAAGLYVVRVRTQTHAMARLFALLE